MANISSIRTESRYGGTGGNEVQELEANDFAVRIERDPAGRVTGRVDFEDDHRQNAFITAGRTANAFGGAVMNEKVASNVGIFMFALPAPAVVAWAVGGVVGFGKGVVDAVGGESTKTVQDRRERAFAAFSDLQKSTGWKAAVDVQIRAYLPGQKPR